VQKHEFNHPPRGHNNERDNMKDNAEHYIDLAYLQGQLLALYETRNRLQEEINKKEAEVKQERDKK
jgi:hypothetical protein